MSKPVFEDLLTFSNGRRNRKSYFLISIVYAIPMLILSIFGTILDQTGTSLDQIANNGNRNEFIGEMFMIISAFYLFLSIISLILTVLYFAIMSQRCRDINWSGWCALIGLVPIINLIFGLFLFFKKGTPGENQYGQDWLVT